MGFYVEWDERVGSIVQYFHSGVRLQRAELQVLSDVSEEYTASVFGVKQSKKRVSCSRVGRYAALGGTA